MLANTIVLSVNAVNKTLTRISESPGKSVYRLKEATGSFQLTVKQTAYRDSSRSKTVERHTMELVHTVYPIAPALVPEYRKSYQVIENDQETADLTLTRHVSKAISDYLAVAANADQVIVGEY